MKIGFTGTRLGMNQLQADVFRLYIIGHDVTAFHHGDCIGADADAHNIVQPYKIPIIIHPPIDDRFRAHCKSPFSVLKKEYLERNRDIVDQTDLLIAVPVGFNELVRSGTWSTVRYARNCSKNVYIIFMNGEVKEE